ncbi:hypothetical protein N0V90_011482 [Kalmusia sp. IMI 367209]|nr:hypothetical protein N0V90_011482 [Kalmusia sp. IMI 367209]
MFGAAVRLEHLLSILSLPLASLAQNSSYSLENPSGFPPCDALVSAGFSNRILTAASDEYEPRIQSWPSTNGRYHPWCLFQPQTTQELSIGISALHKAGDGAGDWHIAVRSGGHSYPGSNNVDKGVTIDLGHMNGSWSNAERNVASIQPGGHWRDVYANLLDKYNVTVTGGRDGDVGVGGFLLGGGISYYTGENGFGCDTVLNYEVVLANGTIVQANVDENSDLFKALKGGGPNFGIVTRFDLEAMPAVNLAYGQSVILSNYSNDIIDNLIEFTDNAADRPHDHLITLYMHIPTTEGVTVLSIRTNTEDNMNTTAFDRVNKIPALQSSWESMSLADAANASQLQAGYKSSSATLTFLSSPTLLRHAAALHDNLVSSLTSRIGAKNFISSMILQAMPTSYSRIGQQKGGNVMGMDHIGSNGIMWTGGVGVTGDDATFAIAETAFLSMTATLEDFAAKEGLLADFKYMNYAHPAQDVLASYGTDNLSFMKKVAAMYDPEGFWQYRVPGGFKLSRTG